MSTYLALYLFCLLFSVFARISMHRLNLRSKALAIAFLFTAVIGGGTVYIALTLQQATEEIIEQNKLLTESAAQQIGRKAEFLLDSLVRENVLSRRILTREEEKKIDLMLSAIVSTELELYHGTEGGFFFAELDEFLGYAFPTSPSPKPAFGPPPRSYNIIRDQILRSLSERNKIVELHEFDPAIFPLVTIPIERSGKIIGGVWARVHLERMLPTKNLTNILEIVALIAAFGFVAALLFSWNLRHRLDEIRQGLQRMHQDSSVRFPERRGMLGFITRSINEMVEARSKEQERSRVLERELRQREKMATLGKLIAGVAHEVKTPLAIVKTRVQMWQRKLRHQNESRESVVSDESMNLVVQEINRLSDLVRRLLVFSRPVSKPSHPTNVNDVARQTLLCLQPMADQRSIAIEPSFDEEVPDLMLDPHAMEQVFLNVCTNAIEAMTDGGSLRFRTAFLPNKEEIQIHIHDSGRGIPPEVLDKVFDPFFTTKEQGAGLGLSISYEIVQAHGGRIEFVQTNGNGTVCRISLPLTPVPAPIPS